ncbi:MAG TPA: mechanosensitive ion channel family protein [Terriglobales bacterium]|nr:mechanosensitive ion channel family protein [Terriglobales bacterium]
MRIGIRKAAFAVLAVVLPAFSQGGTPNPASAPTSVDAGKIVQFLSATISWYRQRASEQKLANEPADLTYLQENARVADQIVQQAFEFARSEAQRQSQRHATQPATQSTGGNTQYQRLNQALQNIGQQIQQTQTELESNREKLARTPASKRRPIQAQVDELQSELGLLNARRDALQTMTEFVSSSGKGTQIGLRSQIDELARSVPPALSGGSSSTQPSSYTPPALPAKSQPNGIWALISDLLHLSSKVRSINGELSATEGLRKTADSLRAPLVSDLGNLIQQGNQLFAAADTSDPAALAQETQQLDALTGQFKQITGTLLPLSKVGVLIGIYQTTLNNWRDSVHDEEHDELRQLLLRLALLAILIGFIIGIGEIWRRATFRYVHDTRRRYQFLLLRRIVLWVTILIIIILTFASQLGSAVTFAGLITAGIAVAMQNVITSIVGYFFLIGKYGLRVGDRVQIAGVTGEVVDIGLVRIHLMELGGPADSQPTGRVVAFSNSVVFQAGPGIFKQIPGTNFIWHELKLTLATETDYHQARERITQAVDSALGNYRDAIAAQRRLVERNLSTVTATELQPKIRLHYGATGIEATIRYPVEIGKAAEIDEHLMRELIAAFEREPRMKLISAEIPTTKSAG